MNYKIEVPLSPELEKYRDKIEATIKPYIEIAIANNDKISWWQSKFGGLPYFPKGFDYPTTPDGDYLFLVAQINFAEVPQLEGFPNKGIKLEKLAMTQENVSDRQIAELEEILKKVISCSNWSLLTGH